MKDIYKSASAILLFIGLSANVNANSAPADKKKEDSSEPALLKISGKAKATYHSYQNSKSIREDKGKGTLFAIEDSRLDFKVAGRMDNDWTDRTFFDWTVGITGNTGASQNVLENRIRLKGRWGTLLFGNYQGAENFAARGAFTVLGGTGGIDGNYRNAIKSVTGQLNTTDLAGATKYATKITYVTPRYSGFQAALTYVPNSEHKGEGTDGLPISRNSTKSTKSPFDLNSVALGINYINAITQDLTLSLSATGMTAKSRPQEGGGLVQSNLYKAYATAPLHNTKCYALGGVLAYKSFDFGLEWMDNGKSRQVKNAPSVLAPGAAAGANPYVGPLGKFTAGQAFSIGTAYTYGKNKVSYGFYTSQRKFNGDNVKVKAHSLSYDRAIAPGFAFFAEGVAFNLKSTNQAAAFQNSLKTNYGSSSGAPSGGIASNKGNSLLLGAATKF